VKPMSVPVHERAISESSFLANAEALQKLTHELVMNDKYVPKKYRYIWVQGVFGLSMNIFENVRRANILYPRDEETLKTRLYYFVKAETDSEALLSQIAFARETFNIPTSRLGEWEKLCVNTKNSIRRRRDGDFNRFYGKDKKQKR